MSESTFTKPVINWLEKRRAKKEAQRQAAEEAQLAALVGGPVQSEASREVASGDGREAVPGPAGVPRARLPWTSLRRRHPMRLHRR